jgi:hypothetical protein
MRRRIRTAAISLVQAPPASDIESDVLDAIDARQKLKSAIERINDKSKTSEVDFARSFARAIRLSQVVEPDLAVQKNSARTGADERDKHQIEALESILLTVNKLIEELKCDSPAAVNAALTKRIDALEKTRSEKKVAEKDLDEQIKMLKTDLVKLPKTYAKKA